MVHATDLMPTFASILGVDLPTDRMYDGVDQADFMMGKTDKSARESVVIYIGNELFGVKWRNWKLNFSEMDSALSDKRTYNFLKTYNLRTDPAETESRTVPDSWVSKAGLVQYAEHLASLKEHPPIPIGTLDPYEPPR